MYLFIVCRNNIYEKLVKFLKKYDSEENDISVFYQNKNFSCLYMAKNAKQDYSNSLNIFRGHFIDDDKKQIIFSGNKLNACPDSNMPMRGSYIHIKRENDTIYLTNDFFSIRPMFYFSNDNICAVSSSIFLLTRIREITGLKNTINEVSGICSAWINGKGAQLVDTNTIINDIFYAPLNSKIIIFLKDQALLFECKTVSIEQLFNTHYKDHLKDYRAGVLEGAKRLAGLCQGLILQDDIKLKLSLSGGLDSRSILASIIKQAARKNMFFASAKSASEDYKIAERLSKKYNFKLNQYKPSRLGSGTPLARWTLCNAGKYHVFCDNNTADNSEILNITGLGAECIKGQFGWKSLPELYPLMKDNSKVFIKPDKEYIRQKKFLYRILNKCGFFPGNIFRERAKLIYRQQKIFFENLNIDPCSKNLSEYIFTYFRNPAHAGHACYNSFYIFPLMDPQLVALAYSPDNYWKFSDIEGPSIISDLLILLSPALALEPFALGQLKLTSGHVRERISYFGKDILADPYVILGKPDSMASGISEIFMNMAEQAGFNGDSDSENWINLGLAGFEILPPRVRKHFDIYAWLLRNDFPETQKEHKWKWQIGGKLIPFLLARQGISERLNV